MVRLSSGYNAQEIVMERYQAGQVRAALDLRGTAWERHTYAKGGFSNTDLIAIAGIALAAFVLALAAFVLVKCAMKYPGVRQRWYNMGPIKYLCDLSVRLSVRLGVWQRWYSRVVAVATAMELGPDQDLMAMPLPDTPKGPAKKVPGQEAPAKKAPAKKAPAKKAPAKQVPAKEVPAKEVPAKEVPAKKAPAKKAPAKKAPGKKARDTDTSRQVLIGVHTYVDDSE
jgi:hypothetical protein